MNKIASRLFILTVLVYCGTNFLFAQEFKLKGEFIAENLDRSFINVINTSQFISTISHIDGKFEIPVKVGDSILISSVQYKNVKFIVKEDYKKENIEIPLELEVNELQEVDVYSLGLSGDLRKDASDIKTNIFSQTDAGLPAPKQILTRNERRLFTAKSSAGGIPLDYIINLLNGNIKLYKQLIELDKIDKQKNKLASTFPERFYTKDLNLPPDLIEDFVYYCVEKYPNTVVMMRQENTLELFEVLPAIAKEYLEYKESEKDKSQAIDD